MTEASASIPKHPCTGTRKDGQPCAMPALPAADRCFAHDPRYAEARQAARQKGGRNRGAAARLRGLMPPRLIPIFDRLETALARLDAGELEPKRAQAMAAVARAMVSVLQAGELEERLRRLEGRGEP